jgi:hypothetical protein
MSLRALSLHFSLASPLSPWIVDGRPAFDKEAPGAAVATFIFAALTAVKGSPPSAARLRGSARHDSRSAALDGC